MIILMKMMMLMTDSMMQMTILPMKIFIMIILVQASDMILKVGDRPRCPRR